MQRSRIISFDPEPVDELILATTNPDLPPDTPN
jgi:hypothetical protein